MADALRDPAHDLRWIGDAYDQAQRARVEAGERIRAILQGRDASHADPVPMLDASAVLLHIRKGESDGPVPLLGWTYRHHWAEEQKLRSAMQDALAHHPAWPWLSGVKGIGATLAAKLLGRLDIRRAPGPASFWAYCGLATVPGVEYHCDACDLRLSFEPGARVTGRHRINGRRECEGTLTPALGPADGVRMAQSLKRGERARFDATAKKTCYLIGVSLVRAGGRFATDYRAERARLEQERPGWPKGRIHLSALRRIEKALLAELWAAWRSAEEQDGPA